MSEKSMLTRRPVLTGLVATVAVIATGVGVDLWHTKRPPASGPFSDLINLTGDAQSAKRVGQELHAQYHKHSDVCMPGLNSGVAEELRRNVTKGSFPALLEKDTEVDKLVEVSGWVLPQSLAFVCFLAARDHNVCGVEG